MSAFHAVRRGWRRFAGWLAAILGLLAAVLGLLDSGVGHRMIAQRVSQVKPASGLRFHIGRIDGSIYGRMVLRDFRVSDPEGLVFAAPAARLDWRPLRWFANRLDVRSLVIPRAILAKLPHTVPSGKRGPILPGFDIAIGELRIDRLDVAPKVAGVARTGRLAARADIRSGRALIDLDALVAGSDRLLLKLDARPDRDGFDLGVRARGAAGGVLARLLGTRKSVAVDVAGDGRWAR